MSKITVTYEVDGEAVEPGSEKAYALTGEALHAAYALLDEQPTGVVPDDVGVTRRTLMDGLMALGSYCAQVAEGAHRDGGLENSQSEAEGALLRAQSVLRRRSS
jgi:hypothetical protein